jgi:hypothetical protein
MGLTALTSEVISAYPLNRPDSSNANIKVTSPIYKSADDEKRVNFESFTEDFYISYWYPPTTLLSVQFIMDRTVSLDFEIFSAVEVLTKKYRP